MSSVASLSSGSIAHVAGDHLSDDHERVLKQIDIYKIKADHQRQRLAGLREQIVQHNLRHVRRATGGGSAIDISFRESQLETEKHLCVDRLNKKLVALNAQISRNKELRRQIDERRQERCRHDAVYTALEHGMRKNAETMAAVLERGKQTLSREAKAVGELEALNKQLEENKRGLRLEQDQLNKLLQQIQPDNKEEEVKSVLHKRMSRPSASLACLNALAEDSQEGKDQELGDDEAFKRAVELTGIDDVDVLIERLVDKENVHFGLFHRINEIEVEAAKNDARIAAVTQELARVRLNSDSQHQKERRSLEEKRRRLEAELREVAARTEAQVLCWTKVRAEIEVVHDALGLSVHADLIGSDGITENNVMQYLAAIENKASEVLTSLHGDDEDPSAGGGGIPASSPATRAPTTTLTLELPATAEEHSASDNDDDDDDGERPFSFGELKKNLEQRLDVREHGGVT